MDNEEPKPLALVKPEIEQSQDIAALVKQDERRRADACKAEIDAACKRHRCTLEPVVAIAGGKVESDIRIVPQKT